MKNISLLLGLAATIISSTQNAHELPHYKTSEHFDIFCEQQDYEVAEEVLSISEEFIRQISQDFEYECTQKLILEIYPTLQVFHEAINWPDAPDWIISQYDGNVIKKVSPQNPGPAHSQKSVLNGTKVDIACYVITEKYQHHQDIPRWLHQGIGLYKAGWCNYTKLSELLQNNQLPTFAEIEQVEKYNSVSFGEVYGFQLSPTLIHFIETRWGWEKVLELLENPSSFEQVLGVSTVQFEKEWVTFLEGRMKTATQNAQKANTFLSTQEVCLLLGTANKKEIYQSGNCYALKSGANTAVSNRVSSTGPICAQDIKNIKSYFGTTPFCWFVNDADRESNQLLKNTGFKKWKPLSLMKMNLVNLLPVEYPTIEIKKAQNKEDLKICARISTKEYPTIDPDEYTEYLINRAEHDTTSSVCFYLAYQNKLPVSTGRTIKTGNTVSLHSVGTLSEHRKKGIGCAISHKALTDALTNSCTKAILFASEMSKSMFERLGFQQFATYNVCTL